MPMTEPQAMDLLVYLRNIERALWSIRDAMYLNLNEAQKKQLDAWDKERRA